MSEEIKENAGSEEVEETPRPSPAPEVELTVVEGSGEDSGTVKAARFAALRQGPPSPELGSMDLLLDIRLELTAELGRASIPVREVLQIGPGSIVELSKTAGDPVDIFVNGKLIGRGEVVVVDENFGIRVTEIVGKTDVSAQAI
jgi:flagellar motor switch protein FliN